jgi:hypothetical protein
MDGLKWNDPLVPIKSLIRKAHFREQTAGPVSNLDLD